MAGFRTIVTTIPGLDIITQIEGITIVDIAPPANPTGAGTGTVCLVGEFERGPVNAVTEVSGGNDLEIQFGSLGHTYDGVPYQYPVAVKSAQCADYWNGNGFIALRNKSFAKLLICRVDTSSGSVTVSRRASFTGDIPSYNIVNGGTVRASINGAPVVTGTFTGTQGAIVGVGGTFPTGFLGTEFLGLRVTDAPEVIVPFQAADQTLPQVIDRINNTLALDVAYDDGGELGLRAPQEGYDSSIEISSGNAQATLGLPVAEVPSEWTVTVTNVTAGNYIVRLSVTVDGVLTDYDADFDLTGAETLSQARDKLFNTLIALGPSGVVVSQVAPAPNAQVLVEGVPGANAVIAVTVQAEPTPGDVTAVETQAPTYTKVNGTGNVANLQFVTFQEVRAVLEPLGLVVELDAAGHLRVANPDGALTATLQFDATSTATSALGLPVTTIATSAVGAASTMPAGTRFLDATNGTLWVTTHDLSIPVTLTTLPAVKVRPAVDNDTTPVCAAGDLNEVVGTTADAYGVSNATDLVRLTAPQMDVRYLDALAATLDANGPAFGINIIGAARSTQTIMKALRDNALAASVAGLRARKAVVAPPVGTSRATAKSNAITGVGVGSLGRSERATYHYPAMTTLIPEIAAKGVQGGEGFTADGVIEVRSDMFYASVRSILPPEENAGQQLSNTSYGPMKALGLESQFDPAEGGLALEKRDYIDFKAAGICAPIVDRVSGMVFQSDVTSVDPATQPNLADAKRRYMGDFLIDSAGDISAPYVKKLAKSVRRRAHKQAHTTFLNNLLSPDDEDAQRIAGYTVRDEATDSQTALGIQVLRLDVKILPSMDFIVLRTTVGTTVEVEQVA